jgi:RHS repeat-associated protein
MIRLQSTLKTVRSTTSTGCAIFQVRTLAHGQISDIGNTIGWDGYVFNAETANYTVRHRHYSTELGRWLERDPIGYVEGGNLYCYASSRPFSFVDPTGLFGIFDCDDECSPVGAIRVTEVELKIVPGGANPAYYKSINTLLGLCGKTCYLGKKGAQGLGKFAKAYATLIDFNVYVEFESEKCVSTPCWCFWENNEWEEQPETVWKCPLPGMGGATGLFSVPYQGRKEAAKSVQKCIALFLATHPSAKGMI